MSDWQEWQIQFDQVYDGGYRYLDQCGLYMSAIREKLGFMPTTVNPAGCDMEQPEHALRLQASQENFLLTCSDPTKIENFMVAAEFASAKAIELFEPFLVHHNRFVSRSCSFTKDAKKSFQLSIDLLKGPVPEFAKILQLTAVQQDIGFIFESGTQQVQIKFNPVTLNMTAAERRLPIMGMPKAQAAFLERRGKFRLQNARSPAYGLAFDISTTEIEPPSKYSLGELFNRLQDYRDRVIEHLKR
jgi:hypothetical protein